MSIVRIIVSEQEAGMRLDLLLVRHLEGLGRAKAKSLTESGRVTVNGRRGRKGDPIAAQDVVEIEDPPAPAEAVAEPETPLHVLYEDASMVVVDKPAGMPSHPLRSEERGTVAGALLHRYPEMRGVGYSAREPGILHRLDTDTSGLLVAARSAAAFESLRASLRAGEWDKRYRALCAGTVRAPRLIDASIADDRSSPGRVRICLDEVEAQRLGARSAMTEILSAEAIGEATSLVEARARSARRHQVRAHLAAIGHPIVGDAVYGGPAIEGLGRHLLHGSALELVAPSGARLQLEAPLPEDFERFISGSAGRG